MIHGSIDTIIFDCDGTLVDSESITTEVLIELVTPFGLKLDHEETVSLFLGRDMPAIIVYLESQLGHPLPSDFTDEFRRRQAVALRRSVRSFEGAHELLESIDRPTCIASNAPQEKIKINLQTTRLDTYFSPERTFSAYDIQVWKPEPDLFLYAARKMRSTPRQCVVIEDSLAGIQAGLAAGMQVIGFSPDAQKKPTDEVPFVHSLTDLITVL